MKLQLIAEELSRSISYITNGPLVQRQQWDSKESTRGKLRTGRLDCVLSSVTCTWVCEKVE